MHIYICRCIYIILYIQLLFLEIQLLTYTFHIFSLWASAERSLLQWLPSTPRSNFWRKRWSGHHHRATPRPGSCTATPRGISSRAGSYNRPLGRLQRHCQLGGAMADVSWLMFDHFQKSSTPKRKKHAYRAYHLQVPLRSRFLVWFHWCFPVALVEGLQIVLLLVRRCWLHSPGFLGWDAGHCAKHSLLSTSSRLFLQRPEK